MKKTTSMLPADWDRRGLPPWAYGNDELLEIEKDLLFRRHWQLVGHVSDIPEAGDYMCLDVVGERALVVRGRDNAVRAFHNVCRHRGSRVVGDDHGNCRGMIVCPFHGWTYNLDGTLRGAARPSSLPPLDPVAWGLKPIEMEIWQGLVFVRFLPSEQPSIATILAPHADEIAAYRLDQIVPSGEPWAAPAPVNWKAVRDVDNEGYHVAKAHPGLHDLYGQNYIDEPFSSGTSRSFGVFNDGPGHLWSVRHYKNLLPEQDFLPESHRRAWLYVGIFPNTVLGFYPDSIKYYQEFPISIGQTMQSGREYKHRDDSRQMRIARYLSTRIDRYTSDEDVQLTIWSYEATRSSGYDGVLLSDLEYGVRSYHDTLRRLMPVLGLDRPPASGTLRQTNQEMLSRQRETALAAA